MGEIGLPQPEEVSGNEKDDAMGAYLMMFASWAIGLPFPLFNLVAAMIYFFLNGRESRYVAFHAYQSLLSQIPVTLLNAGALGWLVAILLSNFDFSSGFLIYALIVAAANLLYVVFSVVALIRARRGEIYYLSIFGSISFARYYGPNAIALQKRQNRPPRGFED